MTEVLKIDADAAIALYEDALSYYMPEDARDETTAADDTYVAYSDAA